MIFPEDELCPAPPRGKNRTSKIKLPALFRAMRVVVE